MTIKKKEVILSEMILMMCSLTFHSHQSEETSVFAAETFNAHYLSILAVVPMVINLAHMHTAHLKSLKLS